MHVCMCYVSVCRFCASLCGWMYTEWQWFLRYVHRTHLGSFYSVEPNSVGPERDLRLGF